jgi:hypothetical protein
LIATNKVIVTRLPISENVFMECLPIKIVIIGHQSTAYAGNINHGKLTPVEKLINAKNSIMIRLPVSENPIE